MEANSEFFGDIDKFLRMEAKEWDEVTEGIVDIELAGGWLLEDVLDWVSRYVEEAGGTMPRGLPLEGQVMLNIIFSLKNMIGMLRRQLGEDLYGPPASIRESPEKHGYKRAISFKTVCVVCGKTIREGSELEEKILSGSCKECSDRVEEGE